MRKATHRGTCQACGSVQRLPAGVLSLHGYAVKWSEFIGTCPGSRNLPFEQSHALIDGYIASAEASAANLRATAAEIRADRAKVWISEWVSNRHTGRGKYVWRELDASAVHFVAFQDSCDAHGWAEVRYLTNDKDKERRIHPTNIVGQQAAVIEETIAYYNDKRARDLEAIAAGHEKYAKWQRERVENWSPQPLFALMAEPVVPAVAELPRPC